MPRELDDLVAKVKSATQEHTRRGELKPGVAPYIRYKVSADFAYGEDGVVANGGMTGIPYQKLDWTYAGSIVTREVLQSPEFTAAAKALADIAASPELIQTFLSNFVLRLATKFAGDEITDDHVTDETNRFMDSISPGPKQCGAKVELLGLILREKQVELPGVLIRQTRREDLEKEMLNFPQTLEPVGVPYPGAIAEIKLIGSMQELHDTAVPKLVTMLRLFVVAAVKHRGYRAFFGLAAGSDGSSRHPGDNSMPMISAAIRSEDEPRLKKFWEEVGRALPKHLYQTPPEKVDHLLVAYERYCAGFLRGDIFEERVANAVMGLEALFLEERQELTYRCRLRVARAMSYLGENPKDVFSLLADAYEARNSFAHGDRLPKKKQIAMKSKYNDPERVYRGVMGYLRKALVATILGGIQKHKLIRLIDNSLVDPSCDRGIAAFFAPAKDIV